MVLAVGILLELQEDIDVHLPDLTLDLASVRIINRHHLWRVYARDFHCPIRDLPARPLINRDDPNIVRFHFPFDCRSDFLLRRAFVLRGSLAANDRHERERDSAEYCNFNSHFG